MPKKLYQYLNHARVEGDVGIEIEVEGERLFTYEIPYWNPVADGSLRGGIEYVSNGAVNIKDVPDAITLLQKEHKKNKAKLNFSFRTSVHVHVNCHDLTNNQLLNFLYLSYLLEPILIEFSGNIRKSNRFCLSLADADGLMFILESLFKTVGKEFRFPGGMNQQELKYSSINLASLREHGTLEFRSMRGNLNKDIIVTWCNALVNIREFAKTFNNPKEIQEKFRYNFDELIVNSLGEACSKEMTNINSSNYLLESFSLTYELPNLAPYKDIPVFMEEIANAIRKGEMRVKKPARRRVFHDGEEFIIEDNHPRMFFEDLQAMQAIREDGVL